MATAAVGDELERWRGDLMSLCYRMLGSVHDAQDAVQETMVRAWRSRDRYDAGRASMRTWLHRIAVNVCLTALEGRARRPLPSAMGEPFDDPAGGFVPGLDVPWLEPVPDAALDPAAVSAERSELRLAFVAALQILSARERAVFLLREGMRETAADVAAALDLSTAAVNSALQRARAKLAGADASTISEPGEEAAVVERYRIAFERGDVAGLTALLADEVILEMPPMFNWYRGTADYAGFMRRVYDQRGAEWAMRPIAANRQPAFAAYCAGTLHTVQLFDVRVGRIARTTVFQSPAVFAAFGLPDALGDLPHDLR